MRFAHVIDRLIEAPVATSFTTVGYRLRQQLADWTPLTDYDLTGHTVAITGPTSGLGEASARQLAAMNASLVLIARNEAKVSALAEELVGLGSGEMSTVVADLGDHDAVRAAAAEMAKDSTPLRALLHNAGALFNERRENGAGMELTTAVQVVSPFILTSALLPRLEAADPGRVITMSSGGMYSTGLRVGSLQMDADGYKGTEQYARCKRAQVTLNEVWAEKLADRPVRFHALHPGWADTPGVDEALPTFGKIVGPLLRSPEEGADTMSWLAADDGAPVDSNGEFWLDRATRSIHKLPTTKRTDTPERRQELWDWVVEASGVGDPVA